MHCNEFSSAKSLFSLFFSFSLFIFIPSPPLFPFSNLQFPPLTFHFLLLFPLFSLSSFFSLMFPSPQGFIPCYPFSLFSFSPPFLFPLFSYISIFHNLYFLINKTKSIRILTNMDNITLRGVPFRVNMRTDALYLLTTNKFLDSTDV